MKFPNVCVSLGTGSPRSLRCCQNCSCDGLAPLSRRGPRNSTARCERGMPHGHARRSYHGGHRQGSGIGHAIATELASGGMNVVVADIDETAAQAVAAEIAEGGARSRGEGRRRRLHVGHCGRGCRVRRIRQRPRAVQQRGGLLFNKMTGSRSTTGAGCTVSTCGACSTASTRSCRACSSRASRGTS